ncbi:hypothetical protein LB506_001597 [Fusarium annulatum]|nr:hypothetical protein LB506_001597 [Fusarium annulatum]
MDCLGVGNNPNARGHTQRTLTQVNQELAVQSCPWWTTQLGGGRSTPRQLQHSVPRRCAQSKTTGGVKAEKSDKTWRNRVKRGEETAQQEWCGKENPRAAAAAFRSDRRGRKGQGGEIGGDMLLRDTCRTLSRHPWVRRSCLPWFSIPSVPDRAKPDYLTADTIPYSQLESVWGVLWEWISKEPLNLPKMQATKRQRNKEHRKKKGKSAPRV